MFLPLFSFHSILTLFRSMSPTNVIKLLFLRMNVTAKVRKFSQWHSVIINALICFLSFLHKTRTKVCDLEWFDLVKSRVSDLQGHGCSVCRQPIPSPIQVPAFKKSLDSHRTPTWACEILPIPSEILPSLDCTHASAHCYTSTWADT